MKLTPEERKLELVGLLQEELDVHDTLVSTNMEFQKKIKIYLDSLVCVFLLSHLSSPSPGMAYGNVRFFFS